MNQNTRVVFAFTAAIAALLVGVTAIHASETDGLIKKAFEQSYIHRTHLQSDAIGVDVEDGVVTLSGTVADASNMRLAQETAENLDGVIRVDNQLLTQAEHDADRADVWLGRKVKMTLLFRRNVSAIDTTVDVKDGVVVLTGEATSESQKQLTAEWVKDIEGVNSVNNQMTVAKVPAAEERTAGERLDDASITAMVKSTLATHRSTRAIETGVVTREGRVTLTGIAANASEKALVTKLVEDIRGVNRVNNEMTIGIDVTR
jgi:hyperosmotically inducible periplasmic protein